MIKEIWSKYWKIAIGLIIVVLAVAAAYGIFRPAKVIIKQELVVDKYWKNQYFAMETKMRVEYEKKIAIMQQTLEKALNISKNINTETKEKFDPISGKLIERTTIVIDLSMYHATSSSSSSTASTINSGSFSTSTTYVTIITEGKEKIIEKTVTIKENIGLLCVLGQYTSLDNIVGVGPGINLSTNFTIGGGVVYSLDKKVIGYFITTRAGF